MKRISNFAKDANSLVGDSQTNRDGGTEQVDLHLLAAGMVDRVVQHFGEAVGHDPLNILRQLLKPRFDFVLPGAILLKSRQRQCRRKLSQRFQRIASRLGLAFSLQRMRGNQLIEMLVDRLAGDTKFRTRASDKLVRGSRRRLQQELANQELSLLRFHFRTPPPD